MAAESITTTTGTTVRIELHSTDALVILDHPEAPEGGRNLEAGRIVGGIGFQPVPSAEYAMGPEVLRAIADLIEGGE